MKIWMRPFCRRTPQTLATLADSGHTITCFVVAPQGSDVVFTGGEGGELVAWNFKNETTLWHRKEAARNAVTALLLCGDLVISSFDDDNSVRGVDASTGEQRWVSKQHTKGVTALAVCGDFVISGSEDRSVRAVDASTGEQRWVFEGHSKFVAALAVCGDLVISGSADESVRAVDASTGEERWILEGGDSAVTELAVCGDIVISGSRWGYTRGVDVSTGKERWVSSLWRNCVVTALVVCRDLVISGLDDGDVCTVCAMKASTGECCWQFQGHTHPVTSLAVCGNLLISGSAATPSSRSKGPESVRAVDVSTGEERWLFEGHSYTVSAVAVYDNLVISCLGNKSIRAVDVSTGKERYARQFGTLIDSMIISEDLIILGFSAANPYYHSEGGCYQPDAGNIHAVDASTGEERWVYEWDDEKPVTALAICGDLLICGLDRILAVHMSTGKRRWMTTDCRSEILAVWRDLVITSGGFSQLGLRALDGLTGEERWVGVDRGSNHIYATAVAVCGDLVISGWNDSSLRAVDASTGEERWVLEGGYSADDSNDSTKKVTALAVCGDVVISSLDDSSVHAVDASTGEEHSARTFEAKVSSMATHKDFIFLGLLDGTIHVLNATGLGTVAVLTGQHAQQVNALTIHENIVYSSSTKIVRTDLALLSGRGAIVASIVADDYNDKLKHFMQITKPKLDYRFKVAAQVYITLQLASFGFNEATVPDHKELHETLAWTRELGVSAEGLFPTVFVTTCVLVIMFIAIMLTQEHLEFYKFTRPQSKAKYVWIAITVYTQAMTTALFVPVCGTLARVGDCTHDAESHTWWLDAMVRNCLNAAVLSPSMDADSSLRDAALQATDGTVKSSSIECFTIDHLPFAAVGFVLFVLFVCFSARLMRVGGELQNIEMTTNLFDSRGDSSKQRMYVHPLSAHSTAHASVTVLVKTVSVLATTYMGSTHPVVVSAVRPILARLRARQC